MFCVYIRDIFVSKNRKATTLYGHIIWPFDDNDNGNLLLLLLLIIIIIIIIII